MTASIRIKIVKATGWPPEVLISAGCDNLMTEQGADKQARLLHREQTYAIVRKSYNSPYAVRRSSR